ncbi:NADC pyrophosphorylase, partial [Sylvietta virens]|nr:NADC pyrophosphorylase [Sylvietta virens]
VKCSSADEARAAVGAGADILLLDNLAPHVGRMEGVPHRSSTQSRSMEGIALGTLPQFLGPQIDMMSMACLTHIARSLDFALQA